tara:strand:+ start:238 stop:483 length:246 start_codon:yes stop_codon:yes gene_type:complete
MIDKLFRRSSQQIIRLEEKLDKLLTVETTTAEEYRGGLYEMIESIIDKIVVLRARRQFIVNNLITDIGEMEEYERKKTNDK